MKIEFYKTKKEEPILVSSANELPRTGEYVKFLHGEDKMYMVERICYIYNAGDDTGNFCGVEVYLV